MNQNLANFLLCGSVGWNMEILWTGFHSLLSGQWTLTGKSSLLMFPIYGCHYRAFIFPDIFALFCIPGNPLYDRILSD